MTRHVHDVLCAKNYLLIAAKMPLPDRVKTLIEESPVYLKPLMRIVTGMETRRTVIRRLGNGPNKVGPDETDSTFEEFVFRPDPAVVIGHYVLTAWAADEVPNAPVVPSLPASSRSQMLPVKGALR